MRRPQESAKHEQSESIQNQFGKWINVFGRKTKRAGEALPRLYEFEQDEYDTVSDAVKAAEERSKREGRSRRSAPEGQF